MNQQDVFTHPPTKNPPQKSKQKLDFFTRFAARTAKITGTSIVFGMAVGIILVWATTGPLFHFSDTWQLVINTGTTIITFLMVFLIQNTQNRDSAAMHLKIDALIFANRRSHNILVEMEDLSQEELDAIKAWFAQKAEENAEQLEAGNMDTCLGEAKTEVEGKIQEGVQAGIAAATDDITDNARDSVREKAATAGLKS